MQALDLGMEPPWGHGGQLLGGLHPRMQQQPAVLTPNAGETGQISQGVPFARIPTGETQVGGQGLSGCSGWGFLQEFCGGGESGGLQLGMVLSG
jgi:hypothetical protein